MEAKKEREFTILICTFLSGYSFRLYRPSKSPGPSLFHGPVTASMVLYLIDHWVNKHGFRLFVLSQN